MSADAHVDHYFSLKLHLVTFGSFRHQNKGGWWGETCFCFVFFCRKKHSSFSVGLTLLI